MKVYVIRHGQTELNVKGLLNGHIPDNLTDEGRAQAKAAAESLPKSIKHIYSSPLTRARQTAEILNSELHVPITYHDGLKEVGFGDLEGTPFLAEHQERHTNLDYDWRPSGESFDEVKERVLKTIAEIYAKSNDSEALIVAHGGIVRMFTFLETGEKKGEISNAGMFEFDLDKILGAVK